MEQVLEETMSLAATYKAVGFVVGIPKNMDGSFGESARRALNFARKLRPGAVCLLCFGMRD
jgi:RNase H-fold protein (predicted Holliday junction resolvase)